MYKLRREHDSTEPLGKAVIELIPLTLMSEVFVQTYLEESVAKHAHDAVRCLTAPDHFQSFQHQPPFPNRIVSSSHSLARFSS